MKKGRENNQFLPRKFVLSEIDNTIKYYVKDKKDPKVRDYFKLRYHGYKFIWIRVAEKSGKNLIGEDKTEAQN